MPTSPSACLTLVLLAALSGCQAVHHTVHTPELNSGVSGVVFVADGAGGFGAASGSLREAVQETGVSLAVVSVPWSHGYGRVLADVLQRSHMRCQGQELATEVLRFRGSHPGTPVYLAGHSAGCQVALAAAECLPPGSVERIVLLLPAVSTDYDLRPALCCAPEGVDAFVSSQDVVYLGLWTSVLGTTDGRRGEPAAGRAGFRLVLCGPQDTVLYTKLRQHLWHPSLSCTGNYGGHYGVYSQGFLRTFILPLFER